MKGFIEITDGLWYEEATGIPWSTKRSLGVGKGWATDGELKQFTNKNTNGYYQVSVEGRTKCWHRVVYEHFNGPIPKGKQVDHINNIRTDNRITNLQLLSAADNTRSCLKYKTNTSGHPGVCWFKSRQKWQARIKINGKSKFLGYFDDKLAAAEAYKKAKIKYHGQESIRF